DCFDCLVNEGRPARWFSSLPLQCVARPCLLPLLAPQPAAKLLFFETERVTGYLFKVQPREPKSRFGMASAINKRQSAMAQRECAIAFDPVLSLPSFVTPHGAVPRAHHRAVSSVRRSTRW